MKIHSFSSDVYNSKFNEKNNFQSGIALNNLMDSFQKTSFKGKNDTFHLGKLKKVDKMSEAELIEHAEYFHEHGKWRLKSLFRSDSSFVDIFKKNSKGDKALNKLLPYIDEIKKNKTEHLLLINELEKKSLIGEENIVDQKMYLKSNFINMLKLTKKGENTILPNGILLYGPSRQKEGFIEWIKNESPAVFKEVVYDESDFESFFQKITQIAKDSKTTHEYTNDRTILYIKGLDRLLTNDDSSLGRRQIGKFKNFSENLSEEYFTTVLTTTDMPLSTFESASLGDQRFEIQLGLKDGITKEEKDKLRKSKDEVERLNKQAEKSSNFTYTDFWDDSPENGYHMF